MTSSAIGRQSLMFNLEVTLCFVCVRALQQSQVLIKLAAHKSRMTLESERNVTETLTFEVPGLLSVHVEETTLVSLLLSG